MKKRHAMVEITSDKNKENSVQNGERLKVNRITYDGVTGRVYKIWLLNLFMKIITIGIYSFWGKVRLRKYLAGSFSIAGDRFEYTGTGKEMFIGFIKALLILGVLIASYITVSIVVSERLADVLFYSLFFYLLGAAIYASFRYRLARTNWRGIRGLVTGSIFKYANFSIKRTIINILSLGLLVPHSTLARHKYIMDKTMFGSVSASYKGNPKRIFKTYLYSTYSFAAVLVVLIGLFFLSHGKDMMAYMEVTDTLCDKYKAEFQLESWEECPTGEDLRDYYTEDDTGPGIEEFIPIGFIFFMPFMFMVFLPLFICLQAWYKAEVLKEKFRGLRIGDIRFKCNITTWKLIKLNMGNFFIIAFTLGLGAPIVIQRKMRFFAANILIGGDLDTSDVMQAAKQKAGIGEGMDDVFGLDTGFL
jgi:uncharacterized membrane protein YjgN (DUF898 family)